MTAFPTPASGDVWGAQLNSAVRERLIGYDDPTHADWGAASAYDEEFNTSGTALPTGWAWSHQGTSTYSSKFGTGILIPERATAGTAHPPRVLHRALPTEATWTAYMKLTVSAATNHAWSGMVLHDTVSGKSIGHGWNHSGDFGTPPHWLVIMTWLATSYNGSVAQTGVAQDPAGAPQYLAIRRNSGTSYDFLSSTDGSFYKPLKLAHDPSAFLTPDRIGFLAARNHPTDDMAVTCHWLRVRV